MLVVIWEKLLKHRLPEWKYILFLVSGASAFVINHYYNYAPFYYWVINTYTVIWFLLWYWLGLKQAEKPVIWKMLGLAYGVVFSVVYIAFERSAREIVSTGIHASWVLAAAFIGSMAVVIVRGRQLYSADR